MITLWLGISVVVRVGLEVVLISVVVYNHCGHWLVSILLRYTLIILFYMNAKL